MYKNLLALFLVSIAFTTFSQDQIIMPNDFLKITVYGHEDLSRIVKVNNNGTIDFPFMQNVPIDGLSTVKLSELISVQLTRYLNTTPIVTVSFTETHIILVNVLGHLANPGLVQMPVNSRLQAALSQAGNSLPGASLNCVELHRMEGNVKLVQKYDLGWFVLQGDLEQNPILNDGDLVIVKGGPVNSQVKIIGCVNQPGPYSPIYGATIMDMIYLAGGFSEKANVSNIKYFSSASRDSLGEIFNIERYYSSPFQLNLPDVQPGDIIFVQQKNQFWRNIMAVLRDVAAIGSLYYLYWRIDSSN
jgi:polysaccharide biosynthesis/export protein